VFGIGFSLKGHSIVHAPTPQGDFSIEARESGYFLFPGTTRLAEEFNSDQRVKINISFDTKVLSDFAKDDEEAFLPFLQGLKDQIPFSDQDRLLPQMHQALNQILACPYTGKTRALFLESKALELMAYKLEQIKTKTRPSLRQYGVNPYDIERIRHAAGCLRQDPINPPDITTLATTAGMSRSKFYRCFKQVYGHSPLDHLRNHRLQLAKGFLSRGKHNVTEAAFAVGYSNLSYFSKIFTAQFGVLPHKVS
jgi:AraC-like DNA-binding protein